MRILVSLVWALALVLYPACGGRKTPDLQPAAATPEPMGPGDPEPMPVPDLTPPVDAAPSETTP